MVADVLGCRRGLVYSISLIYDFFLSAASSLSPSLFEASLYMPLDLAAGGTGLRDFVWGSIGQPLQSFLWIVTKQQMSDSYILVHPKKNIKKVQKIKECVMMSGSFSFLS